MSSSRIALAARGLGKAYRIAQTGGAQGSSRREETIWALKDITFDLNHGEVVGVIGRNGAGKSTLLKILSRITDPTEGRADLYGRVGSLLEVGSGFHPELTGRENIFLSGGFLGMKRREIARHFDEIVEFSGVERFLDTPVKRYSSGMYVRLAFAVAAHLQPEILLVDEVLAVGDAGFQQKCLGKMEDVAKQGRAVIFVSHYMAAIEALCTRGLLLDGGRLVYDGDLREVVAQYHRNVLDDGDGDARDTTFGDRCRFFRSAQLLDDTGVPTTHLPMGSEFRLRARLEAPEAITYPIFVVMIDSAAGQRMLTTSSPNKPTSIPQLNAPSVLECYIPMLPLAPGEYWVKLGLWRGQYIEQVEHAVRFTVRDADTFGDGWGADKGVCVTPSTWTLGPAAEQPLQVQ
jgi:lipopolysaccharide transport system ATP-binding protein